MFCFTKVFIYLLFVNVYVCETFLMVGFYRSKTFYSAYFLKVSKIVRKAGVESPTLLNPTK